MLRRFVMLLTIACYGSAVAQITNISYKGDNLLIEKKPFQGQYTVTMTRTLADGNVLSEEMDAMVQRDSAGRYRSDAKLVTSGGVSPATPRNISLIFDAITLQSYSWVGASQKGTLGTFKKDSKVTIGYLQLAPDGLEHILPKNIQTSEPKNLGEKKVNGLECTGTLVTTVVAVGTIGNVKPITITEDTWTSKDLKVKVRHVIENPISGTLTEELHDVTREEPSESVFTPPTDVTFKPFTMPAMPHPIPH